MQLPKAICEQIKTAVRKDHHYSEEGQTTVSVCLVCLTWTWQSTRGTRADHEPDVVIHEPFFRDDSRICDACQRVRCYAPALFDWSSRVIGAHKILLAASLNEASLNEALQTPGVKMRRAGPVETPMPRYAREGDAGLDLCAAVRSGVRCRAPDGDAADLDRYLFEDEQGPNLELPAGASAVIPCGWAIQIPPNFEGQVRGRSGGTERRIIVQTGTVDSGYRGEACFHLWNMTGDLFRIYTGDRLAQLVIAPVARVSIDVVTELDPSERGEQGFGSSGGRW